MGNCVLRDCGFDVDKQKASKGVETLNEENVRRKNPLQRKRLKGPNGETVESESDISDEEDLDGDDDIDNFDNKHRHKSKSPDLRLKIPGGGSKKEKESLLRNKGKSRYNDQGYEEPKNVRTSTGDVINELERELRELHYTTTPSYKDENEIEYQNGIGKRSKFAKQSQHTYETAESIGIARISTYDGAEVTEEPINRHASLHKNKKADLLAKTSGSYAVGDQRMQNGAHLNIQGSMSMTPNKYRREDLRNSPYRNTENMRITVTKEVVVQPKTNRGRVIGFENVYFKELVHKNAKNISVSPDIPRILQDDVSDNDSL